MKKAMDYANLIISCLKDDEFNDLTNMKLNKLLYFAQGMYLANYGEPLFDDEIEAWKYGPVIDEVYNNFKKLNKQVITNPTYPVNEYDYSGNEIDVICHTLIDYGQYSASKLVNITHEPNTPWHKIYEENKKKVIPKNEIEEFFKTLPIKKYQYLEQETIGYIDEDGYLVLPKELDDDFDWGKAYGVE